MSRPGARAPAALLEKAMSDAEVHLLRSLLFQQSQLPMAVLDTSGRITDWNPAAERTLGFSKGEAMGQSALLVRRGDDTRRLQLLLKRVVKERRPADFQTTVTRRDGSTVPVELDFAPLADSQGRVVAVGVVLRDRTRRRQLERRLAEHQKMAALGRLAGGMSHHINNILAAASARVEMALATRNPAASRQALRLTSESIDRLTNLTRNLLLFSGADHRPAASCRPGAAVRSLLDHRRGELAARSITLEAEIGETAEVQLGSQDLRQLVENLVLNACEAIDGRGTVRVRLREQARQVLLRVSDDGTGISEDDLPHVFEPFWTTRGSIAGGTGGAVGLGLTVARSLAAAADGSLDVEHSGPGGTTLVVHLPACPAAGSAAGGGKPAAKAGD